MRVNRSILAKLCLLTAFAMPVQPAASATISKGTPPARSSALLLAQADSAAEFTLPASLDGAEALLIDGSSSMRSMNEALTEQFQEQYEDAEVQSEANGSDIAIARLLDREIDLAAIGRPLTEPEQASGLNAVAIAREKIAIIVGPDNPFDGDITFEQFGQIFRGEITDWSELGGEPGPIRFVDRPDFSDTRQAFQSYPTFQSAPFVTGSTADPVAEDETDAVVEALGTDGIGYAIANQVMSNDDVKIISMHQTLPDNPAYPFSQSRNYVYLDDPIESVQGFLGVATGADGQAAVEEVRDAEEAAAVDIEGPLPTATSPDGALTARTTEENLAVIEDEAGNLTPLRGAGGAVTAIAFSPDGETLATGTSSGNVRYWSTDGEPIGPVFPAIVGEDSAVTDLRFESDDKLFAAGSNGRRGLWGLNGLPFGESVAAANTTDGNAADGNTAGDAVGPSPWLWLIPLLALLGGGLWWLLGRKRQSQNTEAIRQTAPTATVPPPATDPETNREVSTRAQSVISTDRVTDDSRVLATEEGSLSSAPLPTGSTEGSVTLGAPGSPVSGAEQPSEPISAQSLPLHESTDLESPDLEGTNLDLSTPGGAGGAAALGGAAVLGGAMLSGLDADIEADDDDEWDDNIDLSLGEDPTESGEPSELSEPSEPSEPTEPTEPTAEPIGEGAADSGPVLEPMAAGLGLAGAAAAGLAGAAVGATASVAAAGNDEDTEPTRDTLIADSEAILDIEPTRDTVIAETETILDIEPTRETIISENAVIFGEAAATTAPVEAANLAEVPTSEPSTFDSSINSTNNMEDPSPLSSLSIEELATVDVGLPELPEGYGESRIVLLPRDPKWAYTYWDVSNEHKEELRQQGGQRLMIRLYDVTDVDLSSAAPHSMQQQDCHEMARSWYLEMPVSDRDYIAEIGYLTADDRWLLLARSASIRVPPIYPSDWVKDQFVTIDWSESLVGRTFGDLGQPYSPEKASDEAVDDLPQIYDDIFALTQGQEALRVAGSLYGSMPHVAPGALTASGNVSGIPGAAAPGFALNASGLNVSGLNMSGIGSGGSALPGRSRNFWLVADAELIVYGATEPTATLTVGDRVVPLNPDGTFRFHVAFPDGQIDYPIRAVAADGEQSRSIHLHFERETPERNTNTKAEAKDEWF